jgi:hypothetical protein
LVALKSEKNPKNLEFANLPSHIHWSILEKLGNEIVQKL